MNVWIKVSEYVNGIAIIIIKPTFVQPNKTLLALTWIDLGDNKEHCFLIKIRMSFRWQEEWKNAEQTNDDNEVTADHWIEDTDIVTNRILDSRRIISLFQIFCHSPKTHKTSSDPIKYFIQMISSQWSDWINKLFLTMDMQ